MSARKRTGIRKIDDVDGGVIAWLHPGGADLDEVMVAIAAHREHDGDIEWAATTPVPRLGPDPQRPDHVDRDDPDNRAAWDAFWDHRANCDYRLEDHPTHVGITGEVLDVDYYRRFPWCHCGEEHTWHYVRSAPGPGASLAVVVSNW